jgi:hypothetical protein
VREHPLGELAEPRDAPGLVHERVEVLGIVVRLADPGSVPDGGQPFQRAGRSERQAEAEERVPVPRPGAAVAGSRCLAVQADRTFTRTWPRWPWRASSQRRSHGCGTSRAAASSPVNR